MITLNLLGLDVEISWTSVFLVLLITDYARGYLKKNDPFVSHRLLNAILGTVFLTFFSLFAHELLHGVLAISFGYVVNKASIWALGAGVYIGTPLHDMEFLKAILILAAGPLSNLFLAFFFRSRSENDYGDWHHQLRFLALINMSLFYINILPIYPLDGGKILNVVLLQFFAEPTSLTISLAITAILVFTMIIFGSGQKILLNKFMPD